MPALSRWPWWRRWFGDRSERAVAAFLRRLGYRIHSTNYMCPGGELDLVALDGRCIVFVEVRSSAKNADRPLASIDRGKRRRITRAATHFLQRHRLQDAECRFDVLIVTWPENVNEPAIDHYRHAFEAEE